MRKDDVIIALLSVIIVLIIIFGLAFTMKSETKCRDYYECPTCSNDISYYKEEGTITNINDNYILVERDSEKQFKANVKITETTTITDYYGNILSITDLNINDVVEVTFDGPVAESWPLQGKALIIMKKS